MNFLDAFVLLWVPCKLWVVPVLLKNRTVVIAWFARGFNFPRGIVSIESSPLNSKRLIFKIRIYKLRHSLFFERDQVNNVTLTQGLIQPLYFCFKSYIVTLQPEEIKTQFKHLLLRSPGSLERIRESCHNLLLAVLLAFTCTWLTHA